MTQGERDLERFWNQTLVTPFNTCYEFIGHIGERGYGLIRFGGKTRLAHRVSYGIHKGPIPSGMVIMHTCDNPRCVRPEHLVAGTQSDNMKDMTKKRRHPYLLTLKGTKQSRERVARWNVGMLNRAKTHCKWGHEYTPENTYLHVTEKKKSRHCRTCSKLKVRSYANKEAA